MENFEQKIPKISEVKSVLTRLSMESNYLFDKPVFSWDEYDFANWKSVLRKMNSKTSPVAKKYNDGGAIESEIADLEAWLEVAEGEEKQLAIDALAIAREKLSKIPVAAEPVSETESEEMASGYNDSWLHSNNYFKAFPQNILGEQMVKTDRYGKEYNAVVGTIDNVNRIEVDTTFLNDIAGEDGIANSVIQLTPEQQALKPENLPVIENAVKEDLKEIGQKITRKSKTKNEVANDLGGPDYDIKTYKEVFKEQNPNVTNEEVRAFIYYKRSLGQPLSKEWYDLAYEGISIQEAIAIEEKSLNLWMEKGLMFYYNGNILPAYLYFAEDVYSKKSRLIKASDDSENSGQDAQYIIENYGQHIYDKQVEMLTEVFNKKNLSKLILKGANADDGLILIPTAKFAREFMIQSLSDELPFKWKLSGKADSYGKPDWLNTNYIRDYDKKEIAELSLQDAFCYWLVTKHNSIEFKKDISYIDIIYYYIQGKFKQFPKNVDESEKAAWKAQEERTKSKAKDEGDRLFLEFLNGELTLNDKVRLETQWNASYNSYVNIDYNKVPVAINMARTVRGEELKLRWEKREAIAMMFSEGSGGLAFDVGVGKGNLLTSNILTPKGNVKMGDIKVGDKVIGKNGKPTTVLGVYPLGKVQCYKVVFSDGSYSEVSDEHLWNVQTINYRSKYPEKWDTVMTKDIIDKLYNYRGDYQYSIPMVNAVEFESKELPIHPYLLGALLGDGCLSGGTISFSNTEKDIIDKISNIVSENFPNEVTLKSDGNGKDFNLTSNLGQKNGLIDAIKHLGLRGTKSNTKFIPEIYKINSVENRLELLRGLLDTDGYLDNRPKSIKKGCVVQYTTTSKQLCEDVKFLIQSFGGTVIVSEKIPTYTHNGERKTGQLAYTLTIRLPKGVVPVSSEKHLNKFVEKTKYQPVRFIQAIEDIGFQEAQCIKVDAQDSLYVCDDFVVTHNTPSAIFTLEQFIISGYCKRPFVVVPNQTYKQWLSEIKMFMPHRKVNDLYNLASDYRESLQDEKGNIMMVEEGSISVLTYEGFEMIGFSESTEQKMLTSLYEILNQGGAEEQASEKKKASFYERLQMLIGKSLKGTMLSIEELGFDHVTFDEAHALKKVFTTVKGESEGESKGKKQRQQYKIQSGTPSSRALKGFMISQYIQQQNYGRNVMLLTATPFTNSPLEIFSMMSLIAYKRLEETDLNNLTNFFDNYIKTSTELVINAQLKPQYRQVVKGFSNLVSLQTLIRRFWNYKTGEDVNVPRPNKIVLPLVSKIIDGTLVRLDENERVLTYLPMTSKQTALMDQIKAYASGKANEGSLGSVSMQIIDEDEDSEGAEGVEIDEDSLTDDEKNGVRILKAMNFARNLALSPYLYEYSGLKNPTYTDYVESSPKLKYVIDCVRSVKEYHESKGESVSGQVIYMDRGIEYFKLIKDYLVYVVGYKPHEIGMMYSGMAGGKDAKETLQNLFLGKKYNKVTKMFEKCTDEERCKVLIGSSTIKEGINLQTHSTVLYNCFLDWNPTDIIQLQGRVWRQGNEFENVRIVNPLMIDSMDIFMFQKIEEKTERINSIWSTDGKNVLKLEEINPTEIKASLIKDPYLLAEITLEEDKSKIADQIAGNEAYKKRVEAIKDSKQAIENRKDDMLNFIKKYKPSYNETDVQKNINEVQRLLKDPKDDKGLPIVGSWERDTYTRRGEEVSSIKDVPYKQYWMDDYISAVRLLNKERRDFLAPRNIHEQELDAYLNHLSKENESLVNEKKNLDSKEVLEVKAQEIIQFRLENKIEEKPVSELVKDFGKLNYLLSIKKSQSQIKEIEAEFFCELVDENGERRIDDEAIKQMEQCLSKLPQTKDKHVDDNGEYTPERKLVHEAIVEQFKANKACVGKEQPIAVLTGGSPASGKSTFLKKYSPYLLSEKIYHIDADEVRAKLPEYKGWNATATHAETKDIVNELLDSVGKPCTFDLIYDGTMNNTRNYLPLIGKLKDMGYKVFIVYIDNVPYSVVKERMLNRYKKSGRYVPMEVVDDFFRRGKDALNELKTKVDGYMVVDGSNTDYKIIEQGGIEIPKDRDYSMLGQEIPAIEEKPVIVEKTASEKSAFIAKRVKALKLAIATGTAKDKAMTEKRVKALELSLKLAPKSEFSKGGGVAAHKLYNTYASSKGGFDLYSTGGDTSTEKFIGNYKTLKEAKGIAKQKGLEARPMHMRYAKGGPIKLSIGDSVTVKDPNSLKNGKSGYVTSVEGSEIIVKFVDGSSGVTKSDKVEVINNIK